MIAVHVGKQHQMNGAEPRIVATRHGVPRVVEEADAGRILENHRAVVRAQLAGMRTDWRDLDVLCERRECGEQKSECCAGDLHVVPPETVDIVGEFAGSTASSYFARVEMPLAIISTL